MKLYELIISAMFFLVLSPIVLAGSGFLKVEVTDCSDSGIDEAKVEVENVETKYTDSDGYAYFVLDPGTYTLTVSKSRYNPNSTDVTIYSDEITTAKICLNKIICKISTKIATEVIGKKVTSTITLANQGNREEDISLLAYLCKPDGTDCKVMDCSDKEIYLLIDENYTITCEKELEKTGTYIVKFAYSLCGISYTRYSDVLNITSFKCEEKYLADVRCYDNYRQKLYQLSNCSTVWKNIEYCTYGCQNSFCLPESVARLGEPIIILDEEYEAKPCEVSVFTFDIKNVGDDEAKFNIEIKGDASNWIHVNPTITLKSNERRTMVGYISLPCAIKGDYQFTVRAFDKTSDSDTAILKVEAKEEVDMSKIVWDIIGIIVVAAIVVIAIRYFKEYVPSRKREEAFRK
jgi:hypothetical protein